MKLLLLFLILISFSAVAAPRRFATGSEFKFNANSGNCPNNQFNVTEGKLTCSNNANFYRHCLITGAFRKGQVCRVQSSVINEGLKARDIELSSGCPSITCQANALQSILPNIISADSLDVEDMKEMFGDLITTREGEDSSSSDLVEVDSSERGTERRDDRRSPADTGGLIIRRRAAPR